MARWEGDAQKRLREAALELYRTRGYDETTVSDIAERAGLTERTFFRYFADKREVLFAGSAHLSQLMVDAVTIAPVDDAPLAAVLRALHAAAPGFDERRAASRERHAIVRGHPELREREVQKLSSMAAAIAASLRGRAVSEPAASLAAEMGIAIFKIAFERWVHDRAQRPFAAHIDETREALTAVAAPAAARRKPKVASAAKRKTRRPRR